MRVIPPAREAWAQMSGAKPATTYDIAQAREAFRLANFGAAADQLAAILASGGDARQAATLLARVELRRGNPGAALAVLSQHLNGARAREVKAETAILSGTAFARLGDPTSARAQFKSATALLTVTDELYGELIYQQAAAEWIERRLDHASRMLENLPAAIAKDLDLQSRILKGAIASARENIAAQGAILLEALQRHRSDPVPNAYLHAMLTTQIAALAVELSSRELREASIQHLPNVQWSADIGDLHFHALRAVAWRHALDGDEFNAFRRLKAALAVTRSTAWRVAALTDRAYLAAALGEQRWSTQELRDAHELAATVDWASVDGEEKLALPTLAEMFAAHDPSVAINYVATFKNIGRRYPRVLSSQNDPRIEALEAFALGTVQAALGEHAEAERLLTNAWSIYDRLGIQWRAGRAALALAHLLPAERGQAWRATAEKSLASYPRSWLARNGTSTSTRASASSPLLEQLTPARRAVFDLLMDGRSTEDIASTLGRSIFTVRNHIKAVFKVFGVTSRPALIVKATHS